MKCNKNAVSSVPFWKWKHLKSYEIMNKLHINVQHWVPSVFPSAFLLIFHTRICRFSSPSLLSTYFCFTICVSERLVYLILLLMLHLILAALLCMFTLVSVFFSSIHLISKILKQWGTSCLTVPIHTLAPLPSLQPLCSCSFNLIFSFSCLVTPKKTNLDQLIFPGDDLQHSLQREGNCGFKLNKKLFTFHFFLLFWSEVSFLVFFMVEIWPVLITPENSKSVFFF